MAHTNGTIYDSNSTEDQLRKKLFMVQADLEYTQKMLARAENELYNIPEAVRQYGYIELSESKRSNPTTITLVEKKLGHITFDELKFKTILGDLMKLHDEGGGIISKVAVGNCLSRFGELVEESRGN